MAEPTTVREELRQARERLHAGGIEDADLEAEVLLRDALGFDRAQLLQRLGEVIDDADVTRFEALIRRRLAHEPSAYITGHREFYGREFLVTPAVLVPRPETETLVEAVIEVARGVGERLVSLVDVGAGSGAIAVSLALALPDAVLYATETSSAALEVAKANAERLGGMGIVFLQGDLLGPLPAPVDIIVANLPYVPARVIEGLEPEVREYEPRLALDGGADGLDLIRRLLEQAPRYLNPGGAICLEIGFDQGATVTALAASALPGAMVEVRKDLAGRDRVVVIKKIG